MELLSPYNAGADGLVVWGATVEAQGTVRVFRQDFSLEDAIEFHAFAPREALPCV
jgi:hypothetical protein